MTRSPRIIDDGEAIPDSEPEGYPGLTAQQSRVLCFIADYQREHGLSPTYSEIAKGVGLVSKGRVATILYGIRDRGFIRFGSGASRNIIIIPRNLDDLKAGFRRLCASDQADFIVWVTAHSETSPFRADQQSTEGFPDDGKVTARGGNYAR